MNLITDEYREQQRKFHEDVPQYGTSAHKFAGDVQLILEQMKYTSVLDYGCGKGHLKQSLGVDIAEYDPAIPGKDGLPNPAELVVCIDVLEHIEPFCIQDVLDHLERLATSMVYLVADLKPARKVLPDGRNAHILLQPAWWWLREFADRWQTIGVRVNENHIIFMGGKQ